MERGGESSECGESGELGGQGKWREEVSPVSLVSWVVQVNGERR